MVLEIWAHGTNEDSNDFPINKNRKNVDPFNPNMESSVVINEPNLAKNSDHDQNTQVKSFAEFAREPVKLHDVSHLSSNGYYGYCNTNGNVNLNSTTEMDFETNNIAPHFERRKRNFTANEEPIQHEFKRSKYEDEIYDNFRQTSFDPNATSIAFSNMSYNQQHEHNHAQHNSPQLDTEMMQTNEESNILPPLRNTSNEQTNQFTHLKQKSITEYSMKEINPNNKKTNNLKNSNISKLQCNYNNDNSCKEINKKAENLLENLFLLTHGGSNYQMWQHYNINIDI